MKRFFFGAKHSVARMETSKYYCFSIIIISSKKNIHLI
jgi:hypothetical protein